MHAITSLLCLTLHTGNEHYERAQRGWSKGMANMKSKVSYTSDTHSNHC